MPALTEADQISEIAFGFMGSKALFAALQSGVFTTLADGSATAPDLAAKANMHPDRMTTLLTALAGLGLVTVEQGRFANSPAAAAFLVKGAKYDFGDYLRLQVGRQMYPLLDQIEDVLAGALAEDATTSYADWFADPAEARLYSESQHAGSLGPARQLARSLDLDGAQSMLDVGGGTGAFAITFCKAEPGLSATILDFPNVATLGRDYVQKAGLGERIRYQEGNALESDWPEGQDLVLMSYLFSGVPGEEHERLIRQAELDSYPGIEAIELVGIPRQADPRGRVHYQSDGGIVLIPDQDKMPGTRLIWGRPPVHASTLELSPNDKLDQLRSKLREMDTVANTRIDLRYRS